MVAQGVKGKIMFTSSVLGYFSIVGYSTYSPGKFALRGLAEALQSEFLMYGIDVHIAFPGTIFSPGFVEENKVKPKVTLKIEERDEGSQPEVVAAALLKGVERGKFHITYDFIGHAFRASTRGSSPGSNGLVDQFYVFVGMVSCSLNPSCLASRNHFYAVWYATVASRCRQGRSRTHSRTLRVPATERLNAVILKIASLSHSMVCLCRRCARDGNCRDTLRYMHL